MKQIETGCLAVVIGAHVPSNNGKVVTVGKYLGDAKEFIEPYNKDHWEINVVLTTAAGWTTRQVPQFMLLRIDGEPELDEEVAELELVK